jgi:hypothetical protein
VLPEETNLAHVGTIHLDGKRIVAPLSYFIHDHFGGLRGLIVGQQNVVSVGSQSVGNGCTDAATTSCDEGDRTAHGVGCASLFMKPCERV